MCWAFARWWPLRWQRWIRGRYGTRLRIGEDQIKATQARLVAAAAKPQ